MRDTRTHYAGADHGGVHDFFRRRFRSSFFVFFREEKIADQILRRFGFSKIDNRVQLKREGLLSGRKKTFLDHFERARGRRIVVARHGNFLINLRGWRSFAFSIAQFLARKIDKSITRREVIDQSEL